jgi:[protein-PII] uridylyltransferase
LRCFLHSRSGRDNNVLTFDAQEQAAEYFAIPRRGPVDARVLPPRARSLSRRGARTRIERGANSSLFTQFKDWRTRLSNADFSVSRERVHLRAPHALEADPELALRLFQFVARHGIRPSSEAEQRLAALAPQLEEWFATPRPIWPQIKEILSLPYAAEAVRGMHETGVLRAVFPEMAQIECLVIRDFYHRYTVDEHTLVTLQILAGLRGARDPGVKRYTDLLSEMEDPALLLSALLFHDVGKGAANGLHAEASAKAQPPRRWSVSACRGPSVSWRAF